MERESLDYEKLLKEAFWDYHISKEDLFKIADSDNFREKKHLFEKILFHSPDRVRYISALFCQKDIEELFNSISKNRFIQHAEQNIELAKYFLLDKSIRIKELQWKKF